MLYDLKTSLGAVIRTQNFEDTPPTLSPLKGMEWVVHVPPPPVPPTPEQLKRRLVEAVQRTLDSEARTKGYDNIVSACSYAAAANPFQAEGLAFLAWRSSVWAYCYQVLADVEAGIRPIPTEAELISELPAYVAP
jgi:hypothetical protein